MSAPHNILSDALQAFSPGGPGVVRLTATAAGAKILEERLLQIVIPTWNAVNNILILPAPDPGKIVIIVGAATGGNLQSSDPDAISIGGEFGLATIAANMMVVAICESPSSWVGITISSGGVPSALSGSGTATSSAFDDIWGWWRADEYTGTSPTISLNDLSGNSRTMTQQAGVLTPGTAANGKARLTGNASTWLSSVAALHSWPVTIITYGQRTLGSTQGHFGHTGAAGYNGLWAGYESTNRFAVYNTDSTLNTNAALDACWIARIGWGSRVSLVNGIIQADDAHAQIVRSGAVATSIGTQYRGLNMDWQECLVWNRALSVAELDEVHAYLNTRYGASIPLFSSYTPAPTISMHGQSNSAGRGDRGVSDANIPVEYRGAIGNANVWHGLTALNANQGAGTGFEALNNQAAKNGYTGNHMLGDSETQPTAYIGAESVLCKEYLDTSGGSVWLNKYAIGSSWLEYNATRHWDPLDNTMTHNNTSRLFGQMGRNWWRQMRVHQAASRRPSILGIVWHQGEQDATNLTTANNYQQNLIDFVRELRAEIGYEQAISPVLLCRLHDELSETYTSTVRTAQAAAAAIIPNCEMVDLDGFEIRSGDNAHLSVNGQIALGQHLATRL
jgi:hypothetical protein